jgi:hypothetical protein
VKGSAPVGSATRFATCQPRPVVDIKSLYLRDSPLQFNPNPTRDQLKRKAAVSYYSHSRVRPRAHSDYE